MIYYGSFPGGTKQGLHRNEQPPPTQQGAFLKAKGLLSQHAVTPEDWDYTLKGLSLINRGEDRRYPRSHGSLNAPGISSVQGTRRERRRWGADYVIFEQPQPPTPDLPAIGKSNIGKSNTGKTYVGKNYVGKSTQLNKDIQRTDLPKKEKSNTDLSKYSFHSYPFPTPLAGRGCCRRERKGTEAAAQSAVEIYREIIKDNIDYDILKQDMKFDGDRLDEIVDLMLETVCTARKRVRIAGDDYPAELVKSKFMKLDGEHIRFVLDCMRENTTKIRNIKQYLKAALFNAPSTIGNYYTSLVAHDMASGALAPKEPHDPYSFKPGESL